MNKVQVYLVIALVFALGVAAFAVQNTAPVSIYFLFWHFNDISLVIVILSSAALGATSILMAGMFKQITQSVELKELKKENKKIKEELEQFQEEADYPKEESNGNKNEANQMDDEETQFENEKQ